MFRDKQIAKTYARFFQARAARWKAVAELEKEIDKLNDEICDLRNKAYEKAYKIGEKRSPYERGDRFRNKIGEVLEICGVWIDVSKTGKSFKITYEMKVCTDEDSEHANQYYGYTELKQALKKKELIPAAKDTQSIGRHIKVKGIVLHNRPKAYENIYIAETENGQLVVFDAYSSTLCEQFKDCEEAKIFRTYNGYYQFKTKNVKGWHDESISIMHIFNDHRELTTEFLM